MKPHAINCPVFHVAAIGKEVVDYDEYRFGFSRKPAEDPWKLTGKITLYGKENEQP